MNIDRNKIDQMNQAEPRPNAWFPAHVQGWVGWSDDRTLRVSLVISGRGLTRM